MNNYKKFQILQIYKLMYSIMDYVNDLRNRNIKNINNNIQSQQ